MFGICCIQISLENEYKHIVMQKCVYRQHQEERP